MLKKNSNKEFLKVIGILDNKRLYLVSIILDAAIVAIFLNILIAYISKNVFNASISGNIKLIIRGSLIALFSFIIGASLKPFLCYTWKKCIRVSMMKFRNLVFDKISSYNMSRINDFHSGDLLSRTINDINSIEGILENEVYNLLLALIIGAAALCCIFMLQFIMGIIVIILGIINILICKKYAGATKSVSVKIEKDKSTMNEKLVDCLHCIKTAKIFNLEDIMSKGFTTKNEMLKKHLIGRDKINGKFSSINFMLLNLNSVGILCIGMIMEMNGLVDIGTIVAIVLLQGNASYLFTNINSFVINIQKSLAGASRVFEILDDDNFENIYDSEDAEKDAEKVKTDCKTDCHSRNNHEEYIDEVEVRNLCFSYEKDKSKLSNSFSDNFSDSFSEEKMALSNMNLSIKAGSTAAFVGKSGCGKSTLISLLLGFYEAEEGEIYIHGRNIKSYSKKELRDLISYVPQMPYLFSGTIAENIGYGKIGASREEIIEASKKANVHELIKKMRDGYDTKITEMGQSLSGGEGQRIAIARAILKGAPILILDEATSALDEITQKEVLNEILKAYEYKTILIIAHRLNTIKNADTIFVMEKGEIVEEGCHDELMKKRGKYQSLWGDASEEIKDLA